MSPPPPSSSPEPTLEEAVSKAGLGLRDTVVLVHARIEYHVNAIMLHRFGTDSLESARMNAKLMSLSDVGIIDGTLRQDLIQIARIRHLFAHRLEVDAREVDGLVAGINRKGAHMTGGGGGGGGGTGKDETAWQAQTMQAGFGSCQCHPSCRAQSEIPAFWPPLQSHATAQAHPHPYTQRRQNTGLGLR